MHTFNDVFHSGITILNSFLIFDLSSTLYAGLIAFESLYSMVLTGITLQSMPENSMTACANSAQLAVPSFE